MTCMMSNYASGRKHAKHLYILAVNLPDTFRCPKRQIATKIYKIICLSSMFYLNQKKKQSKVQFVYCLFKICPPINDSIQADFWPFSYGVTHLSKHTLIFDFPFSITPYSLSMSVGFQQQSFKDLPRHVECLLVTRRT